MLVLQSEDKNVTLSVVFCRVSHPTALFTKRRRLFFGSCNFLLFH